MRVVYGAASVAALSALTVGLSHPAPPDLAEVMFDTTADVPPADPPPSTQLLEVRHLIKYVYLQPGQTAPVGATLITPDAPAPRIVVTTVAAPVVKQPVVSTPTQPKKRVKTRQSGTP